MTIYIIIYFACSAWRHWFFLERSHHHSWLVRLAANRRTNLAHFSSNKFTVYCSFQSRVTKLSWLQNEEVFWMSVLTDIANLLLWYVSKYRFASYQVTQSLYHNMLNCHTGCKNAISIIFLLPLSFSSYLLLPLRFTHRFHPEYYLWSASAQQPSNFHIHTF